MGCIMRYKVITNSSQKLRVRDIPSLSGDVIGYLYKNNIYEIEKNDGEWGYTILPSAGKGGYVSMAYLQPVDDNPDKIAVYFTRDEIKDMIVYLNKLLDGE